MHAFFALAAAAFVVPAVLSAPTGASLDPAVFLQNGQDAQALNTEYLSLNSTDTCKDGQLACIDNSIAHCANSTWSLEPCSKSLSCFAMPSLKESGVVVSCTTNATAASIIEASGATGGVFANSTSNSVALPFDCDGDDESDASSSSSSTTSSVATATGKGASTTTDASSLITDSASATATATSSHGHKHAKTVTVTVIAGSGTVTLPSETFTLNPSQASSFLSSIATESGVSISTVRGSATSSVAASVTRTAHSTVATSIAETSGAAESTIVTFSSTSTDATASAMSTGAVSGFSSAPPVKVGSASASASSAASATSVPVISVGPVTTIILGSASTKATASA
ncbi:uncharacterized protein BXZ73DRAFT_88293 [Epithele typhae]|uniref:uncharacterized protein n=1 Tax=Epithele typhae TaxID=378194 RepID=UPI0020085E21|nr:uncharacterized protein BXZ73DRAFT_88293 [Epithele typhae]KAH9941097.1 hypothetical protein BXZ73DRAFT_88293 [Epithele typhae]